MSRSLYITAPEAHSGKSAVALGLVDLLSRRVGRVGVFRPIINRDHDNDTVIDLSGSWTDALSGLAYDGPVRLADLLTGLPVALLVR